MLKMKHQVIIMWLDFWNHQRDPENHEALASFFGHAPVQRWSRIEHSTPASSSTSTLMEKPSRWIFRMRVQLRPDAVNYWRQNRGPNAFPPKCLIVLTVVDVPLSKQVEVTLCVVAEDLGKFAFSSGGKHSNLWQCGATLATCELTMKMSKQLFLLIQRRKSGRDDRFFNMAAGPRKRDNFQH